MGRTVQKCLVLTDVSRPAFIACIVVLNVARVTVLVEGARSILEQYASSPVTMLAPAVGGAGGARVGAAVGWAGGFGQVSGTIVIYGAFETSAGVTERVKPRHTITLRLGLRACG